MFYRIRDIKVDGDENIYIFESGNKRVQKFDRRGQYLWTIGKSGQGPGEFQTPFLVIIDEKNGIVGVLDQRTLKSFNKNGHYLNRDISFEIINSQLVIDASGEMWGVGFEIERFDTGNPNFFNVLIKYTAQGKTEKKVAKYPYDIFRERTGGGVISAVSGEEFTLSIAPIGDRNLVYGYSKEYEMIIVDSEGNPFLKIKKEDPYQDFTPEERRKIGKAKLPEYKPFFYSIFADSEARIYAQRNNAGRDEKAERIFDIFSRDGYYLYKTICPLNPFVIKNGFFYTQVINDKTGEVHVKRLRIKNWGQIKGGI